MRGVVVSQSLLAAAVFTFICQAGAREQFVCPFPSGLFPDPDPGACRRFYQCDNNIVYTKFCPAGSLYDAYKQYCVDKHLEVACGPQPITEAPAPATADPLAAPPCDPARCQLPDCFCSPDGLAIPGNLTREQTPQMILITFDGSVNKLNADAYRTIFRANRTSPNGCPIRATFLMSHEYSDYSLVQRFYHEGHEMASGSVTRRAGLEDEDARAWEGEMVSMREILGHWAGVDTAGVIGMRAPHVKPGRNTQFQMLVDNGFVWDSSLTAPPLDTPVWPYTLEYAVGHECTAGTCPTHSFPGVWELPMNSHYGKHLSDGSCRYLDRCNLLYHSEDEVVAFLKADLHRHYDQNRAPYQLTLTANWFAQKHLSKAILRFIDYSLSLPDVYYTTVTEALQWMSHPVPLSGLKQFPEWDCKGRVAPPEPCQRPKSCALSLAGALSEPYGIAGGTRYMVTCSQCPHKYPWVLDAFGTGRQNDTYEKFV